MIDFFDCFGQLFLVLSHLFTLLDAFFVIVEDVSDRNRANHIEEQEVDKSSHSHNFKGAVRGGEHWKDALHTSVRLLTLFDKRRDVLNQLDLIYAEHDTQAHSHPDAWLLLFIRKNGLSEREQHVEYDGEAKTPINLNIGIVWQIDG